MNGAVIALTTAYAALGVLLLSLHLKSAWPWQVKAFAIGVAAPLFLATFAAFQALTGWPSDADLPLEFQLHAALVEEPSTGDDQAGAIFLWLTPSPEAEEDGLVDPDGSEVKSPPRAFALPYSRDLHSQVEAMREALQKGQLVAGRHVAGSPLKRRFGQQHGGLDLYTPPPPPLPSKDG